MKKLLLFSLALGIGSMSFAQKAYKPVSTHAPKTQVTNVVAAKSTPITASQGIKPSQTYNLNNRELTFINIGQSGNAYGFYSSPRTYLWADNNINSVAFSHRMIADPPTSYGTSRLAYDVSWEGGEDGTWASNVHVYDPTGPGGTYPQDAARYPQGGIINPVGNTDPANAIYTYFAPTLSGTNDTWGGYAYGINPLTQVDPPAATQNIESNTPPFRLIPDAFTITQDGITWMAEGSYDVPTSTYLGEMIFYRGEMNATGTDITYESWTMDVLENGDAINDTKIAFDPSGQIGYVCIMSPADSDPLDYSSYHPILYETTDGGETWSEDPIHGALGGPDGMEAIKNYLGDDVLDVLYPDGWERETVSYNMGFHTGMAVDYKGNVHLTGIVAPASTDGWYPNPDVMGTFHIIYDRETQSWSAELLYMNRTWEGIFGDLSMYNRPYVSTDMDGRFVFLSWLDTDQDGVEENVNPDIFLVSYDMQAPEGEQYSDVQNVTAFTQAMWTATWGSQSHYVFSELVNNDTEIQVTIPFVYEEVEDVTTQVDFWYIDGYTMTFPNYWVGLEENNVSNISEVKQNYPNPFSNTTTIEVELETSANLSLEIVNLVGQQVMEVNKGQVNAGAHKFEISANNLPTGVYFYTVKAGNNTVTKKMIVE